MGAALVTCVSQTADAVGAHAHGGDVTKKHNGKNAKKKKLVFLAARSEAVALTWRRLRAAAGAVVRALARRVAGDGAALLRGERKKWKK